MARVVLFLASLALTVYALVDCIQTPDDRVPHLPKLVWIILIVLVPWVGPLAWIVVARSSMAGPRGPGGSRGPQDRRGPRGPRGPEDDPDFLRGL